MTVYDFICFYVNNCDKKDFHDPVVYLFTKEILGMELPGVQEAFDRMFVPVEEEAKENCVGVGIVKAIRRPIVTLNGKEYAMRKYLKGEENESR